MAASIPHFISLEVRRSDSLCRLGFLARFWQRAFIAVLWMQTIIHVALEIAGAMEPRASADKDVSGKPFWTVIARRGTVIRSDVIVTIGTLRGHSDFHIDLSLCFGGGSSEADSSRSR